MRQHGLTGLSLAVERGLSAARLILVGMALIFFAGLSRAEGAPADGNAALAVQPGTVTVSRFGPRNSATVNVVAQTTGPMALPPNLDLSFSASPGLSVTIGNATAGSADVSWQVVVEVNGDAPEDAAVTFRLGDKGAADPARASSVQLARASLQVKVEPGRNASPADDVELSIKTDFATITERATAQAYLLIKNKTNYPLRVEGLRVDSPQFLTVRLADGLGGMPRDLDLRSLPMFRAPLSPHGILRIPLDIQVGTPRIGDWLLLASVELARGEGPLEQKGTATIDQKVTVGVPGVSDVLKILDLPSILIVPGALVLGTWALLLSGVATALPNWLQWKASSFWIMAITISILVFWALSLLGIGPDFLVAFGIGNVAWLWVGCVGGAFITFVAYRGIIEFRRRLYQPLETDEPLHILKKLQRARMTFYLAPYDVNQSGQIQRVFGSTFMAPDKKTWIIPRMQLRRLKDDDQAKDQVAEIVKASNRPKGGPAGLIAALEHALNDESVSLIWEEGRTRGPELRDLDSLGTAGMAASPLVLA